MAVKIRLQRGGRKSLPVYSIVVADSRSARDKKFIERLGFFAPKARGEETPFSLNEEKLNQWVAKGAQVSDVVVRLLIKHNLGPAAVKEAYLKMKARRIKAAELAAAAKAAAEAKKAAKDAAPAADAAPAPEAVAQPAEQPAEQPAAQ